MMLMDGPSSAAAEHLVLFTSQDGAVSVQAAIARESIWLTQEQLALVFEVKRPAIAKHLGNIYKSNELDEESTCSILEHVGQGGSRTYPTRYYNLDAIIAVGYRINSRRTMPDFGAIVARNPRYYFSSRSSRRSRPSRIVRGWGGQPGM